MLVAGSLPEVNRADGTLDIARSMDGVPALVAAGVTDFRVNTSLEGDADRATGLLTELVSAFRGTVGRVD